MPVAAQREVGREGAAGCPCIHTKPVNSPLQGTEHHSLRRGLRYICLLQSIQQTLWELHDTMGQWPSRPSGNSVPCAHTGCAVALCLMSQHIISPLVLQALSHQRVSHQASRSLEHGLLPLPASPVPHTGLLGTSCGAQCSGQCSPLGRWDRPP